MTRKMANIIYMNHKKGNIHLSNKIIKRIYDEANSCMVYANAYNSNLETDRKIESEIIDNLIKNNYLEAQAILNEYYSWIK